MQASDQQSLLRSGRDLVLKLDERAVATRLTPNQYESRDSTMKRETKEPTMNPIQERRKFLKTLAFSLGTMAISDLEPAFAKKTPVRKLKIGHTCITWA